MSINVPITELKTGAQAIVVSLNGGHNFQQKLRNMGIREGKSITVVTKQPFGGPIVIEIDGHRTTIGKGMAQKIIVGCDI